jgi:hypothetical protein
MRATVGSQALITNERLGGSTACKMRTSVSEDRNYSISIRIAASENLESSWLTRFSRSCPSVRGTEFFPRLAKGRQEEFLDTPAHLETPTSSPNPEERYAQQERSGILRQAVSTLRPRPREIVEICRQCYLRRAARQLGISKRAAETRLFRARTALRWTICASMHTHPARFQDDYQQHPDTKNPSRTTSGA